MAASALMKNAAGYLLWILVAQTTLVSQLVNGIVLLPPHMAASLARCGGAGLWHYQQRIAVLDHCMLFTALAAALLALHVKHQEAGTKEAQLPARMLRASMLLAVALSLASTVLAAATLFYVLEVRMAAVFSCLSGAAKAAIWAFDAMAGARGSRAPSATTASPLSPSGYPYGVTLGSAVGSTVTGGTAGCYDYWMHTAPRWSLRISCARLAGGTIDDYDDV